MRGPRDGTAKVFLNTPGEIEEIAGCIGGEDGGALLQCIQDAATNKPIALDLVGAERIGVVAHHLFLAKQTSGVFLRIDALDDKTLANALRDLRKQKVKDAADGEGLVKELQAL